MKFQTAVKKIKDRVRADQIVSRNKTNQVLFRRGFFYTNGGSSDKFAESILRQLGKLEVPAEGRSLEGLQGERPGRPAEPLVRPG